jgi:hypothetical protein
MAARVERETMTLAHNARRYAARDMMHRDGEAMCFGDKG